MFAQTSPSRPRQFQPNLTPVSPPSLRENPSFNPSHYQTPRRHNPPTHFPRPHHLYPTKMASPTKKPPHSTNTPRRKPTLQPGCLPPMTVRMSFPRPRSTHQRSPPNSSNGSHIPKPRKSRFHEHLNDDALVVAEYPPGCPLPSPSPKRTPTERPPTTKRNSTTAPETKKSAKPPLQRVFSRIAKKLKEQRFWSATPVEENACSIEEFLALGGKKKPSTAGCESGGTRGDTRDELQL